MASTWPDEYGHGSQVAALAAGRDLRRAVDTTDTAPAASIFGVGVLDDEGFGQLSDPGLTWPNPTNPNDGSLLGEP